MSTREKIERLERRLKARPGIVRRIVRAEQATAEDLTDPRTLIVHTRVVRKER